MLRFILTGYIENALSQAEYDKLEDGTFSGRIPHPAKESSLLVRHYESVKMNCALRLKIGYWSA